MSFLKIFQKLTKNLPKTYQETTRDLPKDNQKFTRDLPITLESANQVCSSAFQVFLIIGKQNRGKTTLIKNIVNAIKDKPIVEVKTLSDLDKTNCVLVIDDLKTEIFKTVVTKLVDILRVARHRNLTIILSHHIVSHIPTELFQLSSKVIFFHTSFNASVNSKILNIIPKSKLELLHDTVLELDYYRYVIVENGKIYGIYENTNIEPILGKPRASEEIKVNNGKNGNSNNVSVNQQIDLLSVIVQRVPEFHYLTVTQKIITIAKLYPNLKPKVIAELVGTTPQNTWKTLSLMRHNKI